MAALGCIHQGCGTIVLCCVHVGSILKQQLHDRIMAASGCVHQGCGTIVACCVHIGSVLKEQHKKRCFSCMRCSQTQHLIEPNVAKFLRRKAGTNFTKLLFRNLCPMEAALDSGVVIEIRQHLVEKVGRQKGLHVKVEVAEISLRGGHNFEVTFCANCGDGL